MLLVGWRLHRPLWQYQPSPHDPAPPIDLENQSTGAASGTFTLTGAAAGAVSVAGTAAGLIDLSGSAVGVVPINGAAAGLIGLSGAATAVVPVSGIAGDTFDLSGLATAAGPSVIQIVRGDDAGGWKKPFYDRQLREFEATLAEIPQAEAPRKAIAEAVAEFVPIAADPRVGETGAKVAAMLADLTKAKRRAEVARQVQAIQVEVQRLAQDYRRKRNNEAALMLLIA